MKLKVKVAVVLTAEEAEVVMSLLHKSVEHGFVKTKKNQQVIDDLHRLNMQAGDVLATTSGTQS